MSIHAVFERSPLHHVFEVVDRRLVALALDGHGPRLGHERAGEARRLFLVGAELVVVVVGGDLLPRVGSLISAVAACPDVLQFLSMQRRLRGLNECVGRRASPRPSPTPWRTA